MSRPGDILRAATRAGVSVTVGDGRRLVLEAAAEPPAAIVDDLKQHAEEIIKLLSAAEAPPSRRAAEPAPTYANGAEHDDADREERAAVMEYDGDIPRHWAEAQARLTSRPPVDVPQRQWDQLRNDFGRFLDRWAYDADVLGWRPADLLGWDPARPYSPIARSLGPIWRFDGAAVIEMTRHSITTTPRRTNRAPDAPTAQAATSRGSQGLAACGCDAGVAYGVDEALAWLEGRGLLRKSAS